jgi:predicted aldo/keto reductase-like oxidoreductase
MWYKPYGSTGKMVSAIGFGGMRFRRIEESKPEYNYDDGAALLLEAQKLGVNYFDTAPYYCDDQSEKIFGHAMADLQKAGTPFYVSTKSGEKDGGKLRAQLETSLKRLNLPKVTFLHIWCVLNLDDYRSRLVPGGAHEAAKRAQAEGLVDHVVFSTHCSGAEIETMVNEGLFEGITLGYNILNFRFRQQGLAAAAAKGLGVVTMNPLGGGVIPQRGAKLDFLKSPADSTVVDAALRFNAAHEQISVVLAGMGSLSEVRQNCEVGNVMGAGAPIPGSTEAHRQFVTARKSLLEVHTAEALDTLCTGCQYCLPCPQDIPIPKFMLSYNERIFGEPQDALGMIKGHWGLNPETANTCIQCGECEARCTQHLPIIQRLEQIGQF